MTGERTTLGFAILGQEVVIFIISNMAAVVRAGQSSLGFWYYLLHLFFNRQQFRADDFQMPQNRKALSLSVMRRCPQRLNSVD